MNGIHDLGGMHGFGAVEVEENEPVFHERWEARTFALTALSGTILGANVDRFRHAVERLDPVTYLTAGYYGKWLRALESQLVDAGLIDPKELAQLVVHLAEGGRSDEIPFPVARVEHEPPPAPAESVFRQIDAEPRFAAGDAVVTRNQHPPGHTRLPGYARGKRGVVTAVYPACVFPDSHAHGRGESPQHLYNVAFAGQELWGAAAEPLTTVHLDLFESYLESGSGRR